ncbi:MAG: FkbM family methyltransferase [Bryobacteraceae bacterium]|jgi:FkbM family methyltransferase
MKRTAGILAVLLVLGAAAYWQRAEIRLARLALAGRASVCPFWEAVRAAHNSRIQNANKDRIAAAMRLMEKDPAGLERWNTPDGPYWLVTGSQWSLAWDLAEQERNIYGAGARAVRAGDVVLDCGANVGVFTRKALRAGARTVVAIELAPDNLECLRRNFPDEIRAGRVIVYPKGVWDRDEWLTLNVVPENSMADSVVMHPEHSRPGPRVPLTTIDKLVAELRLERVDFIKMDIEGAEPNALRGARQTLGSWHPRLALSSYHRPGHPRELPELVRQAWPGYTMQCGPCADVETYIRPDVLYFY